MSASPPLCQTCGGNLAGKRADAKYCDERCKQTAYRGREHHGTISFAFDRVELEEMLISRGYLHEWRRDDREEVEDAFRRFILSAEP